jgi:hypothetical protein
MDFADYYSAGVALQRPPPFGLDEYLNLRRAKGSPLPGCHWPHQTNQPQGSSISAMPVSISAHWWRLGGLPVRVFNDLLNAATSPDRMLGKASQLSNASLGVFLDLWDAVKLFAAEPVISVTPSGCVVAEWVRDEGNLLAVFADSSDELTYSLFENGEPLEDSITKEEIAAFVAGMQARVANPFLWSDA